MRDGWMHVAGFEGQEKFAPRTLASAIYMVEGGETLTSKLESISGGSGIEDAMRYVDSAGNLVESGGAYLQIYNQADSVWEWVNPPFITGVGYRTVERYRGYVLYKRIIDLGALPNNNTKVITLPHEPIWHTAWWEYIGNRGSSYSMLPSENPLWTIDFYRHGNSVTVKTYRDASAYKAYILIEYVE